MIKLYLMKISGLEPDDIKWKKHVSPKRYEKMLSYRQKKDRALSLGVELLLNAALQELYPGIRCPVAYVEDENGKPYLPDYPAIYFNLSHAEEFAVCALSDAALGVDIEYCADIDGDIARSYFLSQEYEYILGKPESERLEAFYNLWVLKESYMKACGAGFRLALDAFCLQMGDSITLIQDGQIQPCSFFLTQFENYKLAVCYQGNEDASITPIFCEQQNLYLTSKKSEE